MRFIKIPPSKSSYQIFLNSSVHGSHGKYNITTLKIPLLAHLYTFFRCSIRLLNKHHLEMLFDLSYYSCCVFGHLTRFFLLQFLLLHFTPHTYRAFTSWSIEQSASYPTVYTWLCFTAAQIWSQLWCFWFLIFILLLIFHFCVWGSNMKRDFWYTIHRINVGNIFLCVTVGVDLVGYMRWNVIILEWTCEIGMKWINLWIKN